MTCSSGGTACSRFDLASLLWRRRALRAASQSGRVTESNEPTASNDAAAFSFPFPKKKRRGRAAGVFLRFDFGIQTRAAGLDAKIELGSNAHPITRSFFVNNGGPRTNAAVASAMRCRLLQNLQELRLTYTACGLCCRN